MLCSDGIHGTMPENELIKETTKNRNVGQTVDNIATQVDGKGRNKGGGHDNLTLAIIETKNHSKLKEKMSTRNKLIVIGLAALLLVSLAFNISQGIKIKKSNSNSESALKLTLERLSEQTQNDTVCITPQGDSIIISKTEKNNKTPLL